MAVYLDANPAVSAVWPYQLENGVLAPQVEAKDLAAQFGVVHLADGPAYRFTVRPGDQYRSSTGYRCLARALSSVQDRGEGDVDAFGLDFRFPPDAVLPTTGWLLFVEAHGAAYAVANWRLTIRPGWKLMLSFNTGTLNTTGGGTGWTPERQIATLEPGRDYRLRCLTRWDPDNGEGLLSIVLDDVELVPADWRTHGTAQETAAGVYVEPYLMIGLYTGSDLSAPLTLLVPRFVYADALAEVAALMDAPQPPPVEPEPDPAPVYVTRAELDDAIASAVAAERARAEDAEQTVAGRVALLEEREAALAAAADSTRAQQTGNFKTLATKYAGNRPVG